MVVCFDGSSHDDKGLKKTDQPAPCSFLVEDSGTLIGVNFKRPPHAFSPFMCK